MSSPWPVGRRPTLPKLGLALLLMGGGGFQLWRTTGPDHRFEADQADVRQLLARNQQLLAEANTLTEELADRERRMAEAEAQGDAAALNRLLGEAHERNSARLRGREAQFRMNQEVEANRLSLIRWRRWQAGIGGTLLLLGGLVVLAAELRPRPRAVPAPEPG